jgi:hypothetical protein
MFNASAMAEDQHRSCLGCFRTASCIILSSELCQVGAV